MTEPVYVVSGRGGQGLVILAAIVPAFVAPVWLLYKSFLYFASFEWHPLFVILAVLGELAGAVYLLISIYRHSPPLISGLLTAAYMGASYGFAAVSWLGADRIWAGGAVTLFGVIGYFIGMAASDKARG